MTSPLDLSEYWRQRAQEASYLEETIQNQRNEITHLQRVCQELQYEKVMSNAGFATDMAQFVQQHAVVGAVVAGGPAGRPGPSQPMVPVAAVMQYLNQISNGLVPSVDHARKRGRSDAVLQQQRVGGTMPPPASPVARAVQRLLTLQRKNVREGDVEEYLEQHYGASASSSTGQQNFYSNNTNSNNGGGGQQGEWALPPPATRAS